MNLKQQQIEDIIFKEEQVIANLERDFPNSTNVNIQRAYISLRRSKDYLNKYLEGLPKGKTE
jgi:hypothetical protein